MDKLKADDIKSLLKGIGELMTGSKEKLCELDARIGDGDLGLTMSLAFTKAAQGISELVESDVGKLLARSGMIMAQAAPSTMGTLMASGFMAGGKALYGKQEIKAKEYSEFLSSFSEALMKRGKAKPGEKTIIDAIYPAAKASEDYINDTLENCSSAAQTAAYEGLLNTKDMIAVHGKAAVFREKTIGIEDPGATVGWMLIKAIADYIKEI